MMKTIYPYSTPDWRIWRYVPNLSKLQAVCLSMNICPREAKEEYGVEDAMRGDDDEGFGGPRVDDLDTRVEFDRRIATFEEVFGSSVDAEAFVTFARMAKWEIPAELSGLIPSLLIDEIKEAVSLDSQASTITVKRNEFLSAGNAPPVPLISPPALIIEPDQSFPAIDRETRTAVDTACAAFWLNRQPQTLRMWASQENGLIRPTRVNGRLAWSVADIRRILSGKTGLSTAVASKEKPS